MSNKMRYAALLLVPFVLLVASCSKKATEQFRDAPRGTHTNTAPATVVEMPDGFSNLSGKCDGPDYVYVIFHNNSPYGSITAVKDDARCTTTTTTSVSGPNG